MLMLPYGQFLAHMPHPMHQFSMITSSELRRRMEPTGQPTMHNGSRQWRHEVATRYLSKRWPSRISRVTPSCASAQARTQASQRVQRSQIHHQQALRFHQALREERIERRAGGGGQPLPVLFLALADQTFQALANGRELLAPSDGTLRRGCAPAPRDRAPCKWRCGRHRQAARSRRSIRRGPDTPAPDRRPDAAPTLSRTPGGSDRSCRPRRPGCKSRRPWCSAPAPLYCAGHR